MEISETPYKYISFIYYKQCDSVFCDIYSNGLLGKDQIDYLDVRAVELFDLYSINERRVRERVILYEKHKLKKWKNQYNEEFFSNKTFRVIRRPVIDVNINLLRNVNFDTEKGFPLNEKLKIRIKNHGIKNKTKNMLWIDESDGEEYNVEENKSNKILKLDISPKQEDLGDWNKKLGIETNVDMFCSNSIKMPADIEVQEFIIKYNNGIQPHKKSEMLNNIKMLISITFLEWGKFTIVGEIAILNEPYAHACGDWLINRIQHNYGTRLNRTELMEYLNYNK